VAITLTSFLSFFGKTGAQLIDALDLTKLTNYTLGANISVIALPGGAQAGSPVLAYANNELDTVATTNDSVQLPPAIPGAWVAINNNGASTARIYAGIAPNVANAYVVDQIVANATVALTANGTPLTLASGYTMEFICTTIGIWKRQTAAS
jgi:hypothetical protein